MHNNYPQVLIAGIHGENITSKIPHTVTGEQGVNIVLETDGTASDITPEEAADGVLNDKKKRGDTISVILVNKIGHAQIQKMTAEEFQAFLKKGKKA